MGDHFGRSFGDGDYAVGSGERGFAVAVGAVAVRRA